MPTLIGRCGGGGGGGALPYCETGQFRPNVIPGGATQFRWTNAAPIFVKTDPMFSIADAGTAIAISSEGTFAINTQVFALSGASSLTSDRTVQFEYLTDFGYTPGGGGDVMGPLVTGQPHLGATEAGYFNEYDGLRDLTFWSGSLAAIGLSALPLKVRPVFDINLPSSPFTFGLSMQILRVANVAS